MTYLQFKISVDQLIRQYFRYTDDITSFGFNIAFSNNTCENASSEIRKKERTVCEYECGERLICREYTKIHDDVVHVNFPYDIVKIRKENCYRKILRVEYFKQFR